MTAPYRRLVATVPAKLNLGLVILGRRPDGFHDLRSVMQTVSIHDQLILERRDASRAGAGLRLQSVTSGLEGLSVADPGLAPEGNLAFRGLEVAFERLGADAGFDLSMTKGIPAASGMGGASADAAAAILLAERATGRDLVDDERAGLAADLGSDVPFFLAGGTALVTGRGEHVEPLPPIGDTRFVVVFPILATPIPRKTARLFAALMPDDLGDDGAVREQVRRIRAGQPIDPSLLGNAFSRPLLALAPELIELRATMASVSRRAVAMTGAGPSHYVIEPDPDRADAVAVGLQDHLRGSALVFVCQPWDGPPAVHVSP